MTSKAEQAPPPLEENDGFKTRPSQRRARKKYYEKMKQDPEWVAKRRAHAAAYRDNNREHYRLTALNSKWRVRARKEATDT